MTHPIAAPAVASQTAAPAAPQARRGRRSAGVAGAFRARAQMAAPAAVQPLNEREIVQIERVRRERAVTPDGHRLVSEDVVDHEEGLQVVTRTFVRESGKGKGKGAPLTRRYVAYRGEEYSAFPDDHQKKHLPAPALDDLKRKAFLKKTKGDDALFYPEEVRGEALQDLVVESVANWVRQGAERSDKVYLARMIGADDGFETDSVEMYYGGPIGLHMRPKAYERMPKADQKVIDEMIQRGVIRIIA